MWEDTYYHYDAIGNVVCTTNVSLISAYDQDAYGNVKTDSQNGHYLTTKEYDQDAGLYYFCDRWYDKDIGLFNQKDRLKMIVVPSLRFDKYLPLTFHNYNFCANNSLKYYDTTGISWWNPISWPLDLIHKGTNALNCLHCINSAYNARINNPDVDRVSEWHDEIAGCACICGKSAEEIINYLNIKLANTVSP